MRSLYLKILIFQNIFFYFEVFSLSLHSLNLSPPITCKYVVVILLGF